jgi:hypothetical protein
MTVKTGTIVDATIMLLHPPPRMPSGHAIPRCTRRRRVSSGTSA